MFHVYAVSMTHPVTGNKKLRQAMNLSIDRELLVQGLWQGKGLVPKAHQFKEYGPPLYMPDLVTVKYDPEQARKLVKESGYDGAPVLLTFLPALLHLRQPGCAGHRRNVAEGRDQRAAARASTATRAT